jgi:hypothetical protein
MRPVLGLALMISLVANAFEPRPKMPRFDVVVVTSPVRFTRSVTEDGVLRFKGRITNYSSLPFLVTSESLGTVSVRSFRCSGKDVWPMTGNVAFDEDPRSDQHTNETILYPSESLVLREFEPVTLTFDPRWTFLLTQYRLSEPARCQVQFEYQYKPRESDHATAPPIISNEVSFEIIR